MGDNNERYFRKISSPRLMPKVNTKIDLEHSTLEGVHYFVQSKIEDIFKLLKKKY